MLWVSFDGVVMVKYVLIFVKTSLSVFHFVVEMLGTHGTLCLLVQNHVVGKLFSFSYVIHDDEYPSHLNEFLVICLSCIKGDAIMNMIK